MPAVPDTMQAIGFAEPGGPEVLRLEQDVPVPQPGPGEILLKVAYAGVNRPDCIRVLRRSSAWKLRARSSRWARASIRRGWASMSAR